MFYLDMINQLPIDKGDTIYLSSSLVKIMWLCKKRSEEFDGNKFLDKVQEAVGNEGTILIPTYNFDFGNCGYYDIVNSKSKVGYLGNIALERSDFKRTKHPMHSFAIWGKKKDLLCDLENSNSFGADSPFAYLLNDGGKEIGIGVGYDQGFTFLHYIETQAKVPYRFSKKLTGTYVTQNGESENREYDYPARDRTIQCVIRLNDLTELLEKNGAAKRMMIYDINCFVLDYAQCYQPLFYDMTQNKCRKIFDFSIDRDVLFSDYYRVHKD